MALLLLFVLGCTQVVAQPTWGAGPASSSGPNVLTLTESLGTYVIENVNMDMYTDMEPGSQGTTCAVIVWDEWDGATTWEVYMMMITDAPNMILATTLNPSPNFNPKYRIAQGARNPDVVIGDAGGTPGRVYIGVVYEDIANNNVEYNEYLIDDLFGTGTTIPNIFSSPGPTVLNTNDARHPRIDALPRDVTPQQWGIGNPYEPLLDFVITWTEDVGGDKIYLTDGTLGGAISGSTQVASGHTSDIAGVLRNGNTQIAYITYNDGSDNLILEEWNAGAPSWIATTTLENTLSIIGEPRIDAPNVDITNTGSHWGVICAVDNTGGASGHEEIRFYDDVNTMTDFSAGGTLDPFDPTGVDEDGYRPAIAVGPGPDDYNSLASALGNNWYHMGYKVSSNNATNPIVATTYEILGLNQFGGYYEVPFNPGNHTAIARPALAFATSSNTGVGNGAAWFNQGATGGYVIQLSWFNTGTNLTYKPGKANSIVETPRLDYKAWPNPGADHVFVNGLKAVNNFIATDIAGRTLLQGSLSPANNKIDISGLPQGLYIFTFNENGAQQQLKLVKQ